MKKQEKNKLAGIALPPDRQAFDEIHIKTIPRFKSSELSGSEWRISSIVEFKYKGNVVGTSTFGSVQDAVHFLVSEYYRKTQPIEYNTSQYYFDYCNQEGCCEKATVTYKMKEQACNEGHRTPASEWANTRRFCEKHKRRGDQSLEDSNTNYTLQK